MWPISLFSLHPGRSFRGRLFSICQVAHSCQPRRQPGDDSKPSSGSRRSAKPSLEDLLGSSYLVRGEACSRWREEPAPHFAEKRGSAPPSLLTTSFRRPCSISLPSSALYCARIAGLGSWPSFAPCSSSLTQSYSIDSFVSYLIELGYVSLGTMISA